MSDLIERLRFVPMPKSKIGMLCKDAADEISRLTAALEAVKRERDEAQSALSRMKEALEREAEYYDCRAGQLDGIPFADVAHICRVMAKRIAREAVLLPDAESGR